MMTKIQNAGSATALCVALTMTFMAATVAPTQAAFDGNINNLFAYGHSNCTNALDPINTVVYGYYGTGKEVDVSKTVDFVARFTRRYASNHDGYKEWRGSTLEGTGNQYVRDHGVCHRMTDNNATSTTPLRSRYHARWSLSSGRMSTLVTPRDSGGPRYVLGTAHYDIHCPKNGGLLNSKHEVYTFNGGRKILSDQLKPYASRSYYRDFGTMKPRHFSCIDKDTGGDGVVAFYLLRPEDFGPNYAN